MHCVNQYSDLYQVAGQIRLAKLSALRLVMRPKATSFYSGCFWLNDQWRIAVRIILGSYYGTFYTAAVLRQSIATFLGPGPRVLHLKPEPMVLA